MRIKTRQKNSGIAIMIVLVAIFFLSALAFNFATSMKVEMKLAAAANYEPELEWGGRSGIELARYVLGQQLTIPNTPYDSLNQKWAGGPGSTNDGVLTDISLTDVPLGDGKFSVKIIDSERKFNINAALANPTILQHALTLMGADAGNIDTIVASIQDWIDLDDQIHVNGAESEYYQTLNPPYFAKNGPIDDLTELLLVKGITPELYWGPNSANHPPSMFQGHPDARAQLQASQQMLPVGLVDVFTPISTGRINLNTASVATLQMIPGIDQNMAGEIIRMRSGPDGVDGTEDDTPLRQPGGQDLINIGLSPVAAQQISTFCDVRSSTFEVQVDVQIGLISRRYFALLRRLSNRDVQILTMRWE